MVPQHRYKLGPLPSRRLSPDNSTLHLSFLSSNSALRLVRHNTSDLFQQTQTTTHSSDFVPHCFTSGIDTASLLSSDVQTAYISGNFFSEVLIPTPVATHVRFPEYFTSQLSRPPTPNFSDYPIRVDGTTIYEPQADPRFTILTERLFNNNDTLSTKRKETELKRLQNSNLELKFEVKVKFHGLNPHPVFQVAKLEYKITYIEFHGDSDLPDSAYGKTIL